MHTPQEPCDHTDVSHLPVRPQPASTNHATKAAGLEATAVSAATTVVSAATTAASMGCGTAAKAECRYSYNPALIRRQN